MSTAAGFPDPTADELELYLRWLAFLRGAVLRKASGIDEAQARWRPDGKLLPLLGIVNHLTHVEWRWIDGAMLGHPTGKDDDEYEPGPVVDHRSRDRGVPGPGCGHRSGGARDRRSLGTRSLR